MLTNFFEINNLDDLQMLNPKFQIYRGQDKRYYIALVDEVGKIIFTSRGFYTKQDVLDYIDEIKRAIFNARAEDLSGSPVIKQCV